MIAHDIEHLIRSQVADSLAFRDVGDDRIGVSLPLIYGDGDSCEVVVRPDDGANSWIFSDSGYVIELGHMQGVDFLSSEYVDRFKRLVDFYGAAEVGGELQIKASSGELSSALFSSIQAFLEVSRLMDAPPERRRSRKKFKKNFSATVENALRGHCEHDWNDPEIDPDRTYKIDYHVNQNGGDEWFILGAGSAAKCWKSASSVQKYRLSKRNPKALVAVSNSAKSDASAIAAVEDFADEIFSMEEQRKELAKFLRHRVLRGGR